jgi:hypothetical protein
MTRHQHLLLGCLFLFALSLAPATTVQAQRAERPFAGTGAPSPKSVLGFTPGDDRKIADWSQISDYFSRLDQASNRVTVQTIGQSTLKRPMIAVFISARENILALNKYKEIQRKLTDPRTIANDAERDRLLATGKAVVAISCSIHSSEIVASQMSMQLGFELATAQDPDTNEILRNTILILIPSANPDGIDIVANWYRKTVGTPYEGREPPELYHHYAGHDDNRDWFMLNLKETQALTRLLWKEWFPQVVYDVHQQGQNGSRMFVPPFFDPQNPNIDPLLLRQVALIGHKMAADLQAAGFKGVITNSLYDTWWHGGFRTAPYFHNSIGILTEAASARLMSPITVTREQLARTTTTRGMRSPLEAATNFPDPWPGGEWKPRTILQMEMVTARSLLSLVAKYRGEYLRNFYELGKKSINEPVLKDEAVAYLIPAGQGRDEAVAKLVGALIDQGIEVFRLDRELHAMYGPQQLQRTNSASERLGSYRVIVAHSTGFHEVPAGSYILFLSQPQRTNVATLFEPQIYPNRFNPQGEAERPYDVAGWTLPMQMGVDSPAVLSIQERPDERKLTLLRDANEVRQDLALSLKKDDRSPIVNPINQPTRIGIYKSWMPNMDEGWTRFVFDAFNVPFASIRDAEVRKGGLASAYDVIILPSQRERDILEGHPVENYPKEYTGGLGASGVANLKTFVEDGGTLICFDDACNIPIKQFKLPLRNVLEGIRSSEFYCPGSIVALDVDSTNPISRGMPRNTSAYFINGSAFEAAADAEVKVVARYAKEDLLQSGWLLGEDKLRGKIALAEAPLGKGRVIVFGFRPQHRAQAWATLPFIWNAIRVRTKS